uniref:NADH dehydrogenase subunit 6 n=1 Tax=Pseudalbara parvula TaxID=2249691 RepID=UPI002176DBBC|nr:NADH dehydrogenase subunit 6 [Pseudalbara parvula]UUF68402.1 NADH dehydrogenase subunit 6 [Pseudalbara parvula]
MTKMFLSLMLIFISLFMIFLNHPLSMGLMILIQTLLICILSGMMIKTYWFSYILFLTFLGGLLVMFIYVSSIASNEMFKFNFKMKFNNIMMIMILISLMLFNMNNLKWMNFNYNSDMNNFYNLLFLNLENNINLSKLYDNQTSLMMMMMIIYLFITLITVVKITNINYGPLRSNI